MKCIFVKAPSECGFYVKRECAAVESHIIDCALNHRKHAFTMTGKATLKRMFEKIVIDSPYRIKGATTKKVT